jgi:hypothetical protein
MLDYPSLGHAIYTSERERKTIAHAVMINIFDHFLLMLTEINNKLTPRRRWLCVSLNAIDYLLSCVHCQLTVAEREEEEGVTVVSCAVTPQFPPHKTRSLPVALFLSQLSEFSLLLIV